MRSNVLPSVLRWPGHPPWRTIAKPGCNTPKHIPVLPSSALDHPGATHPQFLSSKRQVVLSHQLLSKGAAVRCSHAARDGALQGEGGCVRLFLVLLPYFRCAQRRKEKSPFSILDINILNSITADERVGQTERYRCHRPNIPLCWFANIQLPQQPLHIARQS